MREATEILGDRIEQKLALLGQLRDLGRRQTALIETGDLTQLLKLLSAKQRLLAALQALEREYVESGSGNAVARIAAAVKSRYDLTEEADDAIV